MAIKHYAYVFARNYVRSFRVADPEKYLKYQDILVDPDITKVSGVPREYWVREGDDIREMTRGEKMQRRLDIALFGVDRAMDKKKWRIKESYRVKRRRQLKNAIITSAVITGASLALYYCLFLL